ncbi:MAG: 2Fe-2S iron-sulfur cluster-binding protein [Myxococcota bacterium]
MSGGSEERLHRVTVDVGDDEALRRTLEVRHGTRLRTALLEAGLSPYGVWTHRANCGGRGLCATCGVWVMEGPGPEHWHDRAAERFGYPRLACQIAVTESMTIQLLPGKLAWGKLIPTWTRS